MYGKPPVKFRDADHIKKQAELIRDVVQRVIDACEGGTSMDPYARNKIMGGSLAGDVASLAVGMMKFEMENE